MKKNNKHMWSPIEKLNESGIPIECHIMPIVECDNGFKTKKEAEEFLELMDKNGDPCLTDEDGVITHTYVGHRLSPSCICSPALDGHKEDVPVYVHKLFQ